MDLELRVIGLVESPIVDKSDAPKQGDEGAPQTTIEFVAEIAPGLADIAAGDELLVLTWLHLADRSILIVRPRGDESRPMKGVFSTRSPVRPNPIGVHRVRVVAIDGLRFTVDGLEAIDGTPVVDVKSVLGDER